jgi:hypothetical protein
LITTVQNKEDFKNNFEEAFNNISNDKIIVVYTKRSKLKKNTSNFLSLSRKIKKQNKKSKKNNLNIKQNEGSVKIYRVNFVLLKHLLRSDYISKTLCSENDLDYISVIEALLSNCLNISSWKNSKTEEIDLNSLLSQFGETNFNTSKGSKIFDFLMKLCSEQDNYFSLKEENMKIILQSKNLIIDLQTEFLENFISNKLGKESLRVLKAAEILKGKTEQTLQEFCLIQAKSFKKIVIDLVELNLLCNYKVF